MSILDKSLCVDVPRDGYYSNTAFRPKEGKVHQFSYGEMEKATNNFDEEMILGSGGEGKVYKGVIYDVHTNTNITVAAKVFHPDHKIDWSLTRIISTDLDHTNIVSVVGYCNDSPDHRIVVYEYMDKGSLADNLKGPLKLLTWTRRLNIAIDVARALDHLHTGTTDFPDGIIHRDVKPCNILLDKNLHAKLSDFGLMKVCPPPGLCGKNSYLTQLKGTPGYIAPEYITNHRITNKVDVYSYGMVLFELLCGKSPWKCPGKESYYPKNDDNFGDLALENIDPNTLLEISQDCLKLYTDLIGKTLHQNPAARPTMHQVVLELEIVLTMQQQYYQTSQKSVPRELTEPQSLKVYAKVLFQGTTLGSGSVVLVLVLILLEVLRRKFPWTGSDVTYYPREDDNKLGQYWELHDIDSNPTHVISKDHSKEHTDSTEKTLHITPEAWPTMEEDALKMKEHYLSSTSTAYRSLSITILSATNLSSTVSNYWGLYADDSFSRMVNTMPKPWVDTLDSFHASFFNYKSTFNYRVLQSSLQQDGALILVVKLYRKRIFVGDICVGLVSIDLKKLFESGRSGMNSYPVEFENAQATEGMLRFSYTFGDLESIDVRKYEHSLMGSTTLLEDSKIVEYTVNQLFSFALKL